MGARIVGAGTDSIRITGVPELGGARHAVMPDRIEAGTAMVAAAITGGDIVVRNVIPEHLEAVTAKLREAGVEVEPAGAGSAPCARLRAAEGVLRADTAASRLSD